MESTQRNVKCWYSKQQNDTWRAGEKGKEDISVLYKPDDDDDEEFEQLRLKIERLM